MRGTIPRAMEQGSAGRKRPRGGNSRAHVRRTVLPVVRALLWGLVVVAAVMRPSAQAADWPMWGGNEGRTHCSADSPPGDLHILWTRELPLPVPAWPDAAILDFDAGEIRCE